MIEQYSKSNLYSFWFHRVWGKVLFHIEETGDDIIRDQWKGNIFFTRIFYINVLRNLTFYLRFLLRKLSFRVILGAFVVNLIGKECIFCQKNNVYSIVPNYPWLQMPWKKRNSTCGYSTIICSFIIILYIFVVTFCLFFFCWK